MEQSTNTQSWDNLVTCNLIKLDSITKLLFSQAVRNYTLR